MIVTIVLNIASYIILAALLCFELGKLDSGLWTLDWTVDWNLDSILDWKLDCRGMLINY